ncbi:MAG: T9SS type A sorting domain-containing protein, partial [FCB group bacterium]|nr:T9SS type A sorting domain-containing protein [FCB group bacterium]
TLVISIGGGYWTFKLVKFDPTYVVDNVVPDNFALKQNYPNPFNPSTTIRYSLIESGQVVLKLFNIRGQEVATLVNAMASPGEYAYYLDASDLAAGTYLYAITAGNQTIVKKMVLIK